MHEAMPEALLYSTRKHLAEIKHHPSDESDESVPTKRQNSAGSSCDATGVTAVRGLDTHGLCMFHRERAQLGYLLALL